MANYRRLKIEFNFIRQRKIFFEQFDIIARAIDRKEGLSIYVSFPGTFKNIIIINTGIRSNRLMLSYRQNYMAN